MSNLSGNELSELPSSDLRVVRETNRLDDLMNWTVRKIRCGKQQFLEHVAPEKCQRSSDVFFEKLNADFEAERLAYERYVTLLNEYSIQLEAIAELEKELCATFGELLPLEARFTEPSESTAGQVDQFQQPAQPDTPRQSNAGLVALFGLDATANQDMSPVHIASLNSTKLGLSAAVAETLAKRRANAIRSALYVRAVDCADERLYTLASVAMVDAAEAFQRAKDARLDFDATRNDVDSSTSQRRESQQHLVIAARDCYEQAKREATTKLEILEANKVRAVERALQLLNNSSCSFYTAQTDALCNTLRQHNVSMPSDLNTLISDRMLLSGMLTRDAESTSVVNVRSFARTVSLSALQVRTFTRVHLNDLLTSTSSASQQQS